MPTNLDYEQEVLATIRGFLCVRPEAEKIREAMPALVEVTSRLPLGSLDRWERMIRAELWAAQATNISHRWRFWERRNVFPSWLDLCSADGFTRERTLRTGLDSAPNAFFCLLALRRLNDWVPQVRLAAREHVPLMARRSDPESVASALWCTIAHYSSWGRAGDEDKQALLDLVAIEGVASSLRRKIVQAAAGPAALVLTQMGRTPVVDQWLEHVARDAIQPSVRAQAYRCLLNGRIVWVAGRKWAWKDMRWCKGRFEPVLGERGLSVTTSVRDQLRSAAGDRSSIVRRVAGEYLIAHVREIEMDSYSLVETLATDSSFRVAELGRFLEKRLKIKGKDIDTTSSS